MLSLFASMAPGLLWLDYLLGCVIVHTSGIADESSSHENNSRVRQIVRVRS